MTVAALETILNPPRGKRFLQIEAELGLRAEFLGRKGLKGDRFR